MIMPLVQTTGTRTCDSLLIAFTSMAFNQALNSWLDDVRANRDDWCTIVHSDVEATRLSLKTCLGLLS